MSSYRAAAPMRRSRLSMLVLLAFAIILFLTISSTAAVRAPKINEDEDVAAFQRQQDEQEWWSSWEQQEDPSSYHHQDSGLDRDTSSATRIRGQTFEEEEPSLLLPSSSSSRRREPAHDQRRRSTLFFSLLCQLGLPSLCVCNGSGLQAALALAGGGNVAICPGVLQLDTEIDLSVVPASSGGQEVVCGVLWLWGWESCTIDGRGITRLFRGAPKAPISFRDMTFQAGNGVNESILRGGAFYLTAGSITVSNCIFKNNRAESGGAVSLEGASSVMTIQDSSFQGNTGDAGGAIYAFRSATVVVAGTTLEGNTATNGAGGAIYADESVMRINDSKLVGNEATLVSGTGGAIFSFKSKIDLGSTVFLGNKAGETGTAGDDVFISDNAVDAVDGSFIQCSIVNRVTFCNGLGGLVEFNGSPPENTNCYSAGVSNPNDGSCST